MRPSLKDIIERLRHANMAHGGLDVEKLVSDLIEAFVEIDRRMTELERRAGIEKSPSGVVMRGERPTAPAL